MLQSMTGFGKGAAESENFRIRVEIRCLNSRNMDILLKLPSAFREMEHEIRSLISDKLHRGKADIWIIAENTQTDAGGRLNQSFVHAIYNEIKQFTTQVNLPENGILEAILRMPEAFKSDESTAEKNDMEALKNALNEALIQVGEFRNQEGKYLQVDLLKRIENIEAGKAQLVPFEQPRIDRMRKRLSENLHASVGITAIDANRLEEELIYYLEKLDITEEKVRLTGHLQYFRDLVKNEGSDAGRKLGFLAQEIGREINTIGSKANDADIQKIVVGMKDELEKIKEQLLNIL